MTKIGSTTDAAAATVARVSLRIDAGATTAMPSRTSGAIVSGCLGTGLVRRVAHPFLAVTRDAFAVIVVLAAIEPVRVNAGAIGALGSPAVRVGQTAGRPAR